MWGYSGPFPFGLSDGVFFLRTDWELSSKNDSVLLLLWLYVLLTRVFLTYSGKMADFSPYHFFKRIKEAAEHMATSLFSGGLFREEDSVESLSSYVRHNECKPEQISVGDRQGESSYHWGPEQLAACEMLLTWRVQARASCPCGQEGRADWQ